MPGTYHVPGDDCSGDEVVCPGQNTCVDYGKKNLLVDEVLP